MQTMTEKMDILEAANVRLVIERAELQAEVESLRQFKKDNTCADCGIVLGVNPGDRKTCEWCHQPYCQNYTKGRYEYADLIITDETAMRYKCHKH